MKFFDFIYTNILFSKKGDNSIDALVVVTLCQTFNVLTIINLFLFFSKITNDYDIPTIFILILILLFFVNFYYCKVKKNEDRFLDKKRYTSLKCTLLIILYFFFSFALIGLTYYLFKEF